MSYAIKAAIDDPTPNVLVFPAQKTMYGGKQIGPGDELFLFASENQGGKGLVAFGIVATAETIERSSRNAREAPRVSITVNSLVRAQRVLGRSELKPFTNWADELPQTELNFKFYRQATNKVVAISDRTTSFLKKFF